MADGRAWVLTTAPCPCHLPSPASRPRGGGSPMWFEQVMFFIAAFGALAGAIGVVVLRNPFFSVLALVGHLFSLAILFLLLRAEFLAAAQVVVYAGAVMVLYVFVVAYIGGVEEPPFGEDRTGVGRVGPIFAFALLVEICIAVLGS